MVRTLQRKITRARPTSQAAPSQSSYDLQQSTNQIANGSLGSVDESMGNEFATFDLGAEDFSFLETDMLFWDDELMSLSSLDANSLEVW